MTVKEVVLEKSGMKAVISPELGGTILSFSDQNELGETRHWLRPVGVDLSDATPEAFRTGCFPLFPFSNRIANNKLSIEGEVYPLLSNIPGEVLIHGHSWMGAWDVQQQSQSSVTLMFNLPHEQVASYGWPFQFQAEQKFELLESGLKVTLKLTNTSSKTMPAGMGLHPYFDAQQEVSVTTRCQGIWLGSDENIPNQHSNDHPALADLASGVLPKGLDNNFTQWQGAADIRWAGRADYLTLTASDLFRHLVIFSPNEPHFCLEPVTHVTNAFNEPEWGDALGGMQMLSPNESLQGDICFTIQRA
ncbi:aldose 1-epimerase [Marinomonas epiphytica]